MGMFWRLVVSAILMGGMALWLPHAISTEAARVDPSAGGVFGPVAKDNDNAGDNMDNWDNVSARRDDNDNAAANPSGVPTDPAQVGAQVSNSELVIDLWRSMDHPYLNNPFMIAVKGSGAPIERVWWWAEGPGNYANGDDLALRGQVVHECGGANPCEQSWSVVPRAVGQYFIHARVRDTSGREVATVWQIFISSNPR